MPETPLDHLLYFSMKAKGGLRAAGITTLEAAAALSDDQILALENVGPESLRRIRRWQAGEPEEYPEKRIRVGNAEARARIFELYKVHRAGGQSREDALSEAEADLAFFNGEG